MTYILGSKCIDGIVMIADKKITIEGGTEYEYDNKLFCDIKNIIIGFSGSRSSFYLFKNGISESLTHYKNAYKEEPSIHKIIEIISEISYKYYDKYGRRFDSFDSLIGISGKRLIKSPSALYYFYNDGRMEPVLRYKSIGSGAPYASIFLKKIWKENMTMKQNAELAYFLIKYIEKFELDFTVGVNNHQPQIWYLPNNGESYELSENEIREFETTTQDKIKKINKFIGKFWNNI